MKYYKYEIDGEGEIPVFTNTLKPGTLKIRKLTQWHEGDDPDQGQLFHFKIKLVNPDGTPFEDQTMEYQIREIENIGNVDAEQEP